MTAIKNWEPSLNSENWNEVLIDGGADPEQEHDGRLFTLTRDLTEAELLPLIDLEGCVACDLDFGHRCIRVDGPLVLIVHHYLTTLDD